jgi:hypothetical protein
LKLSNQAHTPLPLSAYHRCRPVRSHRLYTAATAQLTIATSVGNGETIQGKARGEEKNQIKNWALPGIEPGTSRTLSEHNTTILKGQPCVAAFVVGMICQVVLEGKQALTARRQTASLCRTAAACAHHPQPRQSPRDHAPGGAGRRWSWAGKNEGRGRDTHVAGHSHSRRATMHHQDPRGSNQWPPAQGTAQKAVRGCD